MFTRSGEPVWIRLAQDIHSIVDVAEGGDPSILRSMISHSSRRSKRSPRTPAPRYRRRTKTASERETSGHCTCMSEIKLLKDAVSSLQANILLMKQESHAIKRLQTDHINYVKSSVHDLKSVILQSSSSVRESSDTTLCAMQNLTQSLVQRIMDFEDRVRLLEATISCNDEQLVSKQSVPTETMSHEPLPPNIPSTHVFTAVPFGNHHGDASHVNDMKGSPIPVVITTRGNTERIPEDDFVVPRPKRMRHFCVLGLSKNMSVELLKEDIEQQGPTVYNMRVMPSQRNPDKVIVRLSVFANELASCVMDYDFWPHYVTCRPWSSRWRRARNENGGYAGSEEHRRPRATVYRKAGSFAIGNMTDIPPRFQRRLIAQTDSVKTLPVTYEHGNRYEALLTDVD